MKKLLVCILSLFILISVLPTGLYWWALKNVHSYPTASKVELSLGERQELWQMYQGYGEPRIEGVSPYGYIHYTYCQMNHGLDS